LVQQLIFRVSSLQIKGDFIFLRGLCSYHLQRYSVLWHRNGAIYSRYFFSSRSPTHSAIIFSGSLWLVGIWNSKTLGWRVKKFKVTRRGASPCRLSIYANNAPPDSNVWENFRVRVRMEHIPNLLYCAENNMGEDDVLLRDSQDDKAPDYIPFLLRVALAQQLLILLHRNC
jgi:hypothetical protein